VSSAPVADTGARVRGSMAALALGDALGASVEFCGRREIESRFGAAGVRKLEPWGGHPAGSHTDDTQMTLATARGILTAAAGGDPDPSAAVIDEYVVWGERQDEPGFRRAPGAACLAATAALALDPAPRPADGQGRGCGAVMRMAPAGLAGLPDPFGLGAWLGVLTHAHPAGYLSAGALAEIVRQLVDGQDLDTALDAALQRLAEVRAADDGWPSLPWWPQDRSWPRPPASLHEGRDIVASALADARRLAATGQMDIDAIEALGEGWLGDDALAIAVLCVLRHPDDLVDCLAAAASHGGDSDSTAAIAGAIAGAHLGIAAVPPEWLGRLEDGEEILGLADRLAALHTGGGARGRSPEAG
jgi:ADP-ribosyl-[dinitrogen reductase] hydrolase